MCCVGLCLTGQLANVAYEFLGFLISKYSVSLSLRFNGHFPGEPGLAGVYWSKWWWRWWWQLDYWSCKSCKAPVKSSSPTNKHPVFFTGRMPFLSPNQQCQSSESTERKISHSMDLVAPSSHGVFQLCIWPLIAQRFFIFSHFFLFYLGHAWYGMV